MYLEKMRGLNYEGWKFVYRGSDLLGSAKALLVEFTTAEREARERTSQLLLDPKIDANSKEMAQAKVDITENAQKAEHLQVLVHEFAQRPDETYFLSAGDVVFFNYPKKAPSLEKVG